MWVMYFYRIVVGFFLQLPSYPHEAPKKTFYCLKICSTNFILFFETSFFLPMQTLMPMDILFVFLETFIDVAFSLAAELYLHGKFEVADDHGPSTRIFHGATVLQLYLVKSSNWIKVIDRGQESLQLLRNLSSRTYTRSVPYKKIDNCHIDLQMLILNFCKGQDYQNRQRRFNLN